MPSLNVVFFLDGCLPGCRGHLFSALQQSSEDLCRQIEREGLLGNVYIYVYIER